MTNLQTKKLDRLPADAVLCIADFLPVVSAACLALCNRNLKNLLGLRSWKLLHDGEEDGIRVAFLQCLAKDLPAYFVCFTCTRLHPTCAVQWPKSVPHSQTLPCVSNDASFHQHWNSSYSLKFAHVQLAMARYHNGPDFGIPLEAFSHTELELSRLCRTTTLISIDARIASNELLLRSQMWILLPRDRQGEFFDEHLERQLCLHIRIMRRKSRDQRLRQLLRCSLEHLRDQTGCSFCPHSLHCGQCCIDFQVEAIDLKERGVAIRVTRWINLGAGITPDDPRWQSHLRLRMPKGLDCLPLPAGSIRANFEDQDGASLDRITEENAVKLLSLRQPMSETPVYNNLVWRVRYPGSTWWYLVPSAPVQKNTKGGPTAIANLVSLGRYLVGLFSRYFT